MLMDASVSLRATVPVTESETLERERRGEGDWEERGYTLSTSSDHTLHLERKISGNDAETIEEAAELLYRAIDDPDALVHEMVPDEIRDRDGYTVNYRGDDAELVVSTNGLPHVFLAARKRALKKTKQSMSRRGTSVEQVVVRWFGSDPDEVTESGLIDVRFTDLPEACRHVLYGVLIDHTTGGEIDADVVPPYEEWDDPRLDKQDMLPERDEQPAD